MKLRLFSILPVATLIVTFIFFWELRGMILRQEAGRIPMKMKNVSVAGFLPSCLRAIPFVFSLQSMHSPWPNAMQKTRESEFLSVHEKESLLCKHF